MSELMPKIENWFEFLSVHREMIQDKVRINAYHNAIKQCVHKGDVVVDVGTGTGILAFLCLKAGASKVYAIERTEIIEVAKQNAKYNNFFERIEFLNVDSRQIELEEKVDIIVSEVIGHFALEENMLDSIIDARDRFLKKSGRLIPQSVDIFFVPVELPDIYSQEINFWQEKIKGLDFSPTKELAVNNVYLGKIREDQFLSDPQNAGKIDLTIARTVNMQLNCQFLVKKKGMFFGLGGWFYAKLFNNIGINTSPLSPPTHWQQCFFPIKKPFQVLPGEKIIVDFYSKSLGDDVIWNWNINIIKNDSSNTSFQQSTSALVNKTSLKHFWEMSQRSPKPKRVHEFLIEQV